MATYNFKASERHAVLTVHDLRGYVCGCELKFLTLHVIPVSLGGKPDELAKLLEELGRPDDFDLTSVENWLPSYS